MNQTPRSHSALLAAALTLVSLSVGCKESPVPSKPVVEPAATPTPAPTPVVPTDTRVVPVSGGDAVIEAFFDRNLEAWPKWKITSESPKAEGDQQWCMVVLKWKAEEAGEGPTIERSYAGSGVQLENYSQLVLNAGLPKIGRAHV